MSRKLLLYLYSSNNIAGSLMGLAGLGLFFLGVIESFWFLIVGGLYVAGVLGMPRRQDLKLALEARLSAEELEDALNRIVSKIKRRVSKEVLARVKSIQESVLAVLPRITEMGHSQYDIHLIKQTVLDYLPSALENYLKLPRAYATMHPVRDGKTSKQLLIEQLDVLDRRMREILEDVHRNDTQALVVHGRFLKDKFGDSSEF